MNTSSPNPMTADRLPGAADSSWTLVSASGEGQTGTHTLTINAPFPFTVGRKTGCSGQINNKTVSSVHAEFCLHDGALWLTDKQSTNGTYVNGRRLTVPVRLHENDLVQFAEVAYRLTGEARESASQTINEDVCDQALALVQFDRMMVERLVTPVYQPIVDVNNGELRGYEILARSQLFGLETAQSMFGAAARMNMEVELSRMLRLEGARQCTQLPAGSTLFVNTHPLEIQRDGLIESLAEMQALVPNFNIVLEVHEAAVTDPARMKLLKSQLGSINIGLAYDDFGAGQTRLSELSEAPPDFLKFDISLIRNLHQATPSRLNMLASLVQIVLDLGVNPLAEGVEQEVEAEVCRSLGFKTAQGFYYGFPTAIAELTNQQTF